MVNTAKHNVYLWVVLTLAFIFGIFAPSIFGMDGFQGGFAISTFCIFLTITGIVVIFMFLGRARAAGDILKGDKILVHWSYSSAQWQHYSEKDYKMERSDKWKLYRLVMIITAVVTFGFWLIHLDSALLMLGIFIGLGILLAFTIVVTTGYDHWQNTKYQGEVYITPDGAYVGRKLHLWKGWGASLDAVEYDDTNKLVLITYSMPSRTGRNSSTVRLPVPPGQEGKARQIVEKLLLPVNSQPADI